MGLTSKCSPVLLGRKLYHHPSAEAVNGLQDLYSDYLICWFGPTTATGFSRLLNREIDLAPKKK